MIPARSNRAPATRGRSRKSVESAGAAATSCIRQMLERAWPRHRSTRCMACGIWARLMVETDHGFHRTRPFAPELSTQTRCIPVPSAYWCGSRACRACVTNALRIRRRD